MGFKIGVPGLRISPRRISVGPRIARVSVGRGGPRISSGIGPVGASVGPRGGRIRAGIGPVSVSAGSGGVRVGGGAGPVGGSVGRGGVYVNVGAGPFWLDGKRSFSGTTPYRRVSLSNHYEKYRAQMKGAGVQKRNRSEMANAAVQAQYFETLSMIAWAQRYKKIKPPKVPDLPSREEIYLDIRTKKRASSNHRFWHNLSQEALADEIDEKFLELNEERELLLGDCNSGFKQFMDLEPKDVSNCSTSNPLR
jgi:hypothetical protein